MSREFSALANKGLFKFQQCINFFFFFLPFALFINMENGIILKVRLKRSKHESLYFRLVYKKTSKNNGNEVTQLLKNGK